MTNELLMMKKLIAALNEYTEYYLMGDPKISDTEWDKLYFKLKTLEERTGITYPDSPTQKIHYVVKDKLEKVNHSHPMLSLDKTKSLKDIENFMQHQQVVFMCKMDGLTCSLRYKEGKLVSAETRGNGYVGEDIMHNVRLMKNVPLTVSTKADLTVDGEVICDTEYFEKEFSKVFKNVRNFASGSIRLLDSKEGEFRRLKFVAWDVITGLDKLSLLSERLSALRKFGFEVVPCVVSDETFNYKRIEQTMTDMKEIANVMNYPIDGVVVKYDDVDYYYSLGSTAHHFRGGLAFKFGDESIETRLLDIEWQLGKSGVITPVAKFEPVLLENTVVEKASLHNVRVLHEMLGEYFGVGQTVLVQKSNQIIPQIVGSYPGYDVELHEPEYCPVCGGPTSYVETRTSRVLVCTNPDCQGRLASKITHFVSKDGVNMVGISDGIINMLIREGYLEKIEDLFTLRKHRTLLSRRRRFSVKVVDNILKAIETGRKPTLGQFISAIHIPNIGPVVAASIGERFQSWEVFRACKDYRFIPNLGETMNDSLLSFDYTEAQSLIDKGYITIQLTPEQPVGEKPLEGLNIVISGKLEIANNRRALQNTLAILGATVRDSVSKNTDILIANDNLSKAEKVRKAKELGIRILSEQELINEYKIELYIRAKA